MKNSLLSPLALLLCSTLFVGCSGTMNSSQPGMASGQATQIYIQEPVRTAPGVVEYVWEEPMVDVVEIPPGLDPDGVYYRPAHQSIVEIRQGRWKYYTPKEQR
ncbi:MAG: hypothetical protein KDD70_14845 [Bdellovibrionales bacterium]|nr:hypothetical protein [Bdellovibrionales bacterium]